MRRRDFIAGLAGAAGAAHWPSAAGAQRVRRVATLTRNPDSDLSAFEEALAKSGWIAGRNITLERHSYGGDFRLARVRVIAADLVAKVPDVIMCVGTEPAAILQQQTRTIPIVFINVADPVAIGFVANYAHPGGNMTGFTAMEFSIAGKWLSLLKDVAPMVVAVTVLYSPDNANWRGYLPVIESAARALRMKVRAVPAANADELAREIESFAHQAGAGMIVVPSGLTVGNREMIVAFAARHGLPAMYPYSNFVRSGGLASYGSEFSDPYRRAAQYVDRILNGDKPGDLPVQAPTKFEFIINLKTAASIGLTIAPSLQVLADEVIE